MKEMNLLQYLKSKEFLRTIILVVAISLILLFGLFKWLHSYTKQDEKIEVPNLEMLSLAETEKVLEEHKLNFVVIDSASFNPKFPAKSVIEQNPLPGDFVKENRKIYLTLNPSNYRKVTIPNVLDQTKRQVVIQLKSLGFRIGKERYIKDLGRDVVRKLEIGRKEVKPGQKLPKNTVIDLVLGDGLVKRDSIN
ncbi:PASTA domain-containing protein [Lutimonas sp.]|uniref:PASTA domain-containing protein n=1 Tax=Lutimonas sp. TaxID=1872403 RepID=UPI003D9B8679